MLAVASVLFGAEGIESLVLASPALSVTRWEADGRAHLSRLSPEDQAVIARHDANEPHEAEAFARAEKAYSRRHFCRLDPWPEAMQEAARGFGGDVYHAMWGHCEWKATGNLRAYEAVDRLGTIDVPTLLTCGRFDEATPEATHFFAERFPRATARVFENSAHMAQEGNIAG